MIDVTVILEVFFVVLDKKSELSCSFIEASSKIGRKIKYLKAKQRTCQKGQGLRHWQGNDHHTTTPFKNMPTLKFKAQTTNAFFATINQMFGDSSQLLYCRVRSNQIKSSSTVQTT